MSDAGYHLRERWMAEVEPGLWKVKCKNCPRRYGRRVFDDPAAALEWWARHEQSRQHAGFSNPRVRAGRYAEETRLAAFFGRR